MSLGTNLTLTPKTTSPFTLANITNAQTRIDELLAGQNELNSDVVIELNNLKDTLNALTLIETVTTADAVVDDVVLSLEDMLGINAGNVINIGADSYTIESIDGNNVTLTSGLVADVASGTKVTRESALNVEEVFEQIRILGEIFSKTGTANDVFDALVILADAWNAGGDLTQAVEGTFDSDTGELTIDLSAFNFASVSDYKFIGSVDNVGALLTSTGFTKVDEATAKVTAYNRACFVEDAVLFDASANSFGVSMIVSYARPHLSFTITDEDGNTTEVA